MHAVIGWLTPNHTRALISSGNETRDLSDYKKKLKSDSDLSHLNRFHLREYLVIK
jgi:hypothetical protein